MELLGVWEQLPHGEALELESVSSFGSSLFPDSPTPPCEAVRMVILLLLPMVASSSQEDVMWTFWVVFPSG